MTTTPGHGDSCECALCYHDHSYARSHLPTDPVDRPLSFAATFLIWAVTLLIICLVVYALGVKK